MLESALMLGADRQSDEIIEKFCRVREWVLPSPDGLSMIADPPMGSSEVRPRGPVSYLNWKTI